LCLRVAAEWALNEIHDKWAFLKVRGLFEIIADKGGGGTVKDEPKLLRMTGEC
jgi:hypothetical protein